MQAFHSLFHAKPSLGTLSAELNAQIITVRPDGGGDGSAGVQGAYVESELEWADWTDPVEEASTQVDRKQAARS